MKTKNKIYLAVTADQYEIPVYFADTVKELAVAMGVSQNLISRYLCLGLIHKKMRFVRVEREVLL